MMRLGKRPVPPSKNLQQRGEVGIQLDLPLGRRSHVLAETAWDGIEEYGLAAKPAPALGAGLLERIAAPANLLSAFKQVKSNKGAAGTDGQSIAEAGEWLYANYLQLSQSLLDGSYRPQPVRGCEIPKANGGKRLLGIPTVIDRTVQQAISQVLMRGYDPTFSASSYGFRPGRNAHQALRAASRLVREGCCYVVDIDLSNFFNEVNHDRLMQRLALCIADKRVLRLIGRTLRTGIMMGGVWQQQVKGTPQGSPLSPLLSNIVLDELDRELERRGHRFCRYADDIVIFTRSEAASQRVLTSISRYLEQEMKLPVNQQKSRAGRVTGTSFLGYSLLRGGLLGLSLKSEQKLKEKLRLLTRRNRGVSLERVIGEVNSALQGWINYFCLASMGKKMERLGEWLRHRLRCYRLKQCKRASGIYRFLTSLGRSRDESRKIAGSSKGWYRLAATPATHQAMNKAWFAQQNLFDLKQYYDLKFSGTA